MDSAQLGALLAELLLPDTTRVKAAERALKPYLKNPLCLGGLLQEIQSNPNSGARQIAAVMLRKKIGSHWPALDAGSQATVQQALLACLQSESDRNVRKAVCTVTCAVAGRCFANPQTHWMELLAFVNACCSAPQEGAREMGYIILEFLAETMATHLPSALPSLVPVLLGGLNAGDSPTVVQAQALKACGGFMTATADSELVLHFADLIPPMLEVLRARCASGDEDVVAEVLEVLDELSQTPIPVLNKHVPAIVQFLLEMVKSEALEATTRDQAGMCLNTLAEHKPKLLGKKGLVAPILEAMLHLMAASPESAAGSLNLALADNEHDPAEGNGKDEEEDDDDDEDGASPCQIAQACIDKLGTSLPMKYIWEPAYSAAMQCLGTGQANWRKAGCSCLGNLAEGCQDPMKLVLEQCLPPVLAAATDADKFTREAACFCLGQMAEHCQPEIMRYQGVVLPVVFNLLDDPMQSVQGVACYVLETFSENLSVATVGPLLPQLTAKLLQLTQSPRLSIREMAFSALSSTCAAAESTMAPYAGDVVKALTEPLQLTEERHFNLRGRSLECLGHLAVAVGKEGFAPYLAMGMHSAEQSLQMDAPELHEYTYAFFGTACRVIGSDFAQFLPTLVPHLCEVVSRSDGEEVNVPEEEGGFDVATAVANNEDGEDGDDGGYTYLQVRTAMLDVKRTAVIALGMIAESAGPAFAGGGYLQPAMEALHNQRDYFHAAVRAQVITALGRVVKGAVCGAFGSVEALPAYTPGDLTRPLESLDAAGMVAGTSNHVVKVLVAAMIEEENKEVVAVACESFQAVLELLGPCALQPVMAAGWLVAEGDSPQSLTATQALLQLLRESAPCQQKSSEVPEAGGGEDGDDDDEDGDHDHELMDAVADLVGGFAKALGPQFAQMAGDVLNVMAKYAKANRPASDRAMAIGCFAEVLEFMGPQAAAPLVPTVAPSIQAGLSDASPSVRRNAAFAAGVLAQTAPEQLAPHFPALLTALHPLFQDTGVEQDFALRDNAVAAAARMMVANLSAVPTAAVLPVYLGSLPLRADFSENNTVYGCVAYLLEARHPDVLALLPAALVAVSHGLQAKDCSDAVKARLVQALKGLAADPAIGASLASALPTLAPDAAAVLQQALNHA